MRSELCKLCLVDEPDNDMITLQAMLTGSIDDHGQTVVGQWS